MEKRGKLLALADRHKSLNAALESSMKQDEVIKLRKEISALEAIAQSYTELKDLERSLEDCESVLRDAGQPEEMHALAAAEQSDVLEQIADQERELARMLVGQEEGDDAKEVVVEVRAGTGGQEAQLFAQEMFEMYKLYCAANGLGWKVLGVSEGEGGGYREATAMVTGGSGDESPYYKLRFEGGVHRVQRRPVTDKTRVHTSTCTVAVLPAPSKTDEFAMLPEKELLVDTHRARGAGGQHVNTTDSAVRITHIPTGIVVSVQDDRSQHRNRAAALTLLTAKVAALRRAERDAARSSQRKSMIGSGERWERIRTYNFPQDRITDHRIGRTETGMDRMMAGDYLNSFTSKLHEEHLRERLKDYLGNEQKKD